MEYILALDGGGTKTDLLLADTNGSILGYYTEAGCNPTRNTDESLLKIAGECRDTIAKHHPDAIDRISVILAGLAGGSHPENSARFRNAFERAFSNGAAVRTVSDTVSALWSGTLGNPGIVLVAGTGATAYGEDARGGKHRVGGWGYLIGDDGSGYALGREAVRAVCRYADGCGPKTALWPKIARTFGLTEPLDIVPWVYGTARPPFDTVVPIVLEAYEEDDQCAVDAVERIVQDQLDLIDAVHHILEFGNDAFTLVLRGGLLNPLSVLRPALLRKMVKRFGESNFITEPAEAPPVLGSAILALRELGLTTPATTHALLADIRSMNRSL